jgi:hypothetical protein
MSAWVSVLTLLAAVIVLLFAGLARLRVAQRRRLVRDQQRWQSDFAARNPKVAAGMPRTTDKYDEAKAVAGRQRWLRQTETGRALKSPRALRRADAGRPRAAVESIATRRVGGSA